jgi:hypothetical protein
MNRHLELPAAIALHAVLAMMAMAIMGTAALFVGAGYVGMTFSRLSRSSAPRGAMRERTA